MYFEDDQSLVDAKKKLKENWKLQKGNKKIKSWSLVPRQRRQKRGLLTVNSCIKVRLDLQADKSPVVVKGPFIPRVVNPRYRIRGTNVWRKRWSVEHLDKEHETNLIY
jgi:hypothetical protein